MRAICHLLKIASQFSFYEGTPHRPLLFPTRISPTWHSQTKTSRTLKTMLQNRSPYQLVIVIGYRLGPAAVGNTNPVHVFLCCTIENFTSTQCLEMQLHEAIFHIENHNEQCPTRIAFNSHSRSSFRWLRQQPCAHHNQPHSHSSLHISTAQNISNTKET